MQRKLAHKGTTGLQQLKKDKTNKCANRKQYRSTIKSKSYTVSALNATKKEKFKL